MYIESFIEIKKEKKQMGVILIFLQHFYFRYCPTINQSITVLYKK